MGSCWGEKKHIACGGGHLGAGGGRRCLRPLGVKHKEKLITKDESHVEVALGEGNYFLIPEEM